MKIEEIEILVNRLIKADKLTSEVLEIIVKRLIDLEAKIKEQEINNGDK